MEIVLSVRAHGALTTLKACTQPEAQEDSSSPYEVKDELRTVLAPSRLLLSSVSVPSEFSSDPAHPIQQFEISVLDAAGALVHSGTYRIHMHVSGGELLGLESGDLRDDTDYTSDVRSSLNSIRNCRICTSGCCAGSTTTQYRCTHRNNKDSLFHDSSSLLIVLRMECKRFSLFSEKMCKTIQVQFSELFNPSFPAGIRRHSVFLPPLPPR